MNIWLSNHMLYVSRTQREEGPILANIISLTFEDPSSENINLLSMVLLLVQYASLQLGTIQ